MSRYFRFDLAALLHVATLKRSHDDLSVVAVVIDQKSISEFYRCNPSCFKGITKDLPSPHVELCLFDQRIEAADPLVANFAGEDSQPYLVKESVGPKDEIVPGKTIARVAKPNIEVVEIMTDAVLRVVTTVDNVSQLDPSDKSTSVQLKRNEGHFHFANKRAKN